MTYLALRRQPRHMASKQAPVWVELARGAFVVVLCTVALVLILSALAFGAPDQFVTSGGLPADSAGLRIRP